MNGSPHILIIDDDATIRRLLIRNLAGMAAQVNEAATATEALDRLAGETPDLILLDIGLPGASGYDICRTIRARPDLAGIPVIMITGNSDPGEHLRALEAGATDFVGKPFRKHELVVRVRNLLDLQLTQKELRRCHIVIEVEKGRQTRDRFERYLSPSIVDRIMDEKQATGLALLDDSYGCNAVIMFADLRGYTRMSETLNPQSVVALLNEYFTLMVRIAHRHEGTTISMAGDSLMVGFGVPYAQDDAASRAVQAALAIRDAFDTIATAWQRQFGVTVGIGIGISSGEVVAGNVGAPEFMNFTLIGDAVNVAARLTNRARSGEILMTDPVHAQTRHLGLRVLELPEVHLKGRTETIDVLCPPAVTRQLVG